MIMKNSHTISAFGTGELCAMNAWEKTATEAMCMQRSKISFHSEFHTYALHHASCVDGSATRDSPLHNTENNSILKK